MSSYSRGEFRTFVNYVQTRIAIYRDKRFKSKLCSCGENVQIYMPTVIEVPDKVHIGDNVSIAPFVHIWGNAGVQIGARTMIASHVAISSATHDPDSANMRGTLITAPVNIGADVWIGAHAAILPGVTVGEHAVIAAGAIVRDAVPSYAIVGGIPAAILRMKR